MTMLYKNPSPAPEPTAEQIINKAAFAHPQRQHFEGLSPEQRTALQHELETGAEMLRRFLGSEVKDVVKAALSEAGEKLDLRNLMRK